MSESNFLSLHTMLIETTKLLRQRFLNSFKEVYKKEWTDKEESDFFKNGAGKEIRDNCKKIQKTCLDSGNSNEWDITLLCAILSSKLFLRTKLYSNHLTQKISSVRNRLSHTATLEISDEVFNELSIELTSIMLELGASKEFVLELKNDKRFQDASKKEPDKNAKFLKESANEEFKKKNYEGAIEIYTSAIILPNLNYQELGVLYRNRSLSNLKLYEETKNGIYLDRAIADAKKTCFYQPMWFKGYAQLGETYHKTNDLEKAVKNYEKAFAFCMNNDEVKNNLALLKVKLGEQYRREHLKQLPLSSEEREEQLLMQLQKSFSSSTNLNQTISELKSNLIKAEPILKDVWTGHEYRDGSKNVKQNYETAAKYYSKAAAVKNAEGIYNLACLTIDGLGVKKDFNAALILLKEAANQKSTRQLMGIEIQNIGVHEAEHRLGLIYQEGTYVITDVCSALFWYELATEHGSSQSPNNLGLMYFKGNGVVRNVEKAEALFILSHERGDVNASANLVDLYIYQMDPKRALEWHEKSLQTFYLLNKLRDTEIREKIKNIKIITTTAEFNKDFNLVIKNFQHCESSMEIPTQYVHSNPIYNIKELINSSKNGSITASEMLSAYSLLCDALNTMRKENSFDRKDVLKKVSTAYSICQVICQIPRLLTEELFKIINSVINEEKNQKSEIDYHARICFVYLNIGDCNLNMNFLKCSLKIYPNDAQMLFLLGTMYAWLKKYENALEIFENLCLLHPTNYEYMYSKAVTSGLLKRSNAMRFYEEFISAAPIDHRKIPESYYALGLCLESQELQKSKNPMESMDLETLLFYYNKGVESEKLQLSCFLPYESNSKKSLEGAISLYKHTQKKLTKKQKKRLAKKNKGLLKTVEPNIKENDKVLEPNIKKNDRVLEPNIKENRKEVVLNHRKVFKMINREITIQSKEMSNLNLSYKPIKIQNNPASIIGLKAVYIKDIDFSKDYVITGYALTVTNVDIPIVGVLTSVHFVVEDENQFVVTLCIYNLGVDYLAIKERFPVGCMFTVINPYVRLAADGRAIIRVDDPNSVVMSSKRKVNICFYCGKEQSTFTCSKCKIAKYCSKLCQNNDLKVLQHEDVCNYLLN